MINDDTKLKILFTIMVILASALIIGLWETIIKPVAMWVINSFY